jgi:hypothetical protein
MTPTKLLAGQETLVSTVVRGTDPCLRKVLAPTPTASNEGDETETGLKGHPGLPAEEKVARTQPNPHADDLRPVLVEDVDNLARNINAGEELKPDGHGLGED